MGEIFVFVFILVLAGFIFAWAVSAGRNNPRNTAPMILVGVGIIVVLAGAYFLADRKMAGAPLSFVEPGKYTVIGIVNDQSLMVGHASSAFYLILKDNDGKTRLYLLPKEQLKGVPAEGGILEVTEIPASNKMVFR